jgi:hypothetical protein
MIRRINQALYCTFGAGSIAFGLFSLFSRHRSSPLEQGHLERELGAAAVFIGLIALWCLFHYERRHLVHGSLIVFAALDSWVHWQDFFAGHRGARSVAYNSVPLAVLLLISALTWLERAKSMDRGAATHST